MKSKISNLWIVIIMPLLLTGCSGIEESHPVYQQYQYPNEAYFGKETYSEILYHSTKTEKNAVIPILEMAEEVFSCLDSETGVNDNAGALAGYYFNERVGRSVASEEHQLELVTVRLEDQAGLMWVAYYRKAYDSDDNLAYGAGSENEKILARWELVQENGVWMVTNVEEAP